MSEYNQDTYDRCVEACLEIYKKFVDVEAMAISPELYKAWEAGRQVCKETEGCEK